MSVSPFYDALEGAQEFALRYPVSEAEGVGPHWNEEGILIPGELEVEDILAVPLGDGQYRLAALCAGPFSCCLLRWGDEFEADSESDTLSNRPATTVFSPKFQ